MQAGTRESQVLRQEGRSSGQGALGAGGEGAGDEAVSGRTEVGTGAEVVSVIASSGDRDVAGSAEVKVAGTGVKVVAGASVHLVQIVCVDVTTVWVRVSEVVTKVLESEVVVMVTGHKVVVVKTISVVMISEAAGVDEAVSGLTTELAEGAEISADGTETSVAGTETAGDVTSVESGSVAGVGTWRMGVGIDSGGAVSV